MEPRLWGSRSCSSSSRSLPPMWGPAAERHSTPTTRRSRADVSISASQHFSISAFLLTNEGRRPKRADMLTSAEWGRVNPSPLRLSGLDADHQSSPRVHPCVGLSAGRLDFGGIFAGTCEVDPGFLDPLGRVGDVATPGHVAPEERNRRFPRGRVVEGRVDPRKAEGLRDGGHGPRVLALIEQRYAFSQPACRVGEPVEAFQGPLELFCVAPALLPSLPKPGLQVLDLLFGQYVLCLDVLQPPFGLAFCHVLGTRADPGKILTARADLVEHGLQLVPARLGFFQGALQFGDTVLEAGNLRPETLDHPFQIPLSGRLLGQPDRLELRKAGPVGAHLGLALDRGFPQPFL